MGRTTLDSADYLQDAGPEVCSVTEHGVSAVEFSDFSVTNP
jgi:hypothetical protein